MLILQAGLKSCAWPRRKRWYRSFCRTRLQLARRGQNVAKNSATLCVEGRAGGLKSTVLRDGRPQEKKYCVEGRAGRRVGSAAINPARPSTHYFPPVLQHVALFLATFWPLLASRSRVRQNDLYHRFRLGKTQLLRPTCIIATGSL